MVRGNILVVDDEPDIRRLVQEILEDEQYRVFTAEDAVSARAAYSRMHPDLILLDIWMPDVDGITLLKEWSSDTQKTVPVVMMSGHGNVETAVEATRLGAYDFIEKPLSMGKLLLTVEHALRASKQNKTTNVPRVSPASSLTGNSAAVVSLRKQLERAAKSDSKILLGGENGCGKGVAARYIHANSERSGGPFVEISLGAVPPENLLKLLFGSEQSGTTQQGSIEQAHGGTLFLNEVGDLDADTQLKLYHALEEKNYLRVGGNSQVNADIRLIASTTYDLITEIKAGRFNEKLYYLLNVVSILIPPLRKRREDIPDLVHRFVDTFTSTEKLPYRSFPISTLNRLRNHDWPGNTRELKNLVQRLLILNRGTEVELDEVDAALQTPATSKNAAPQQASASLFDMSLRDARDAFEKSYLEYHLNETGGNISELARIVGMERTHLYRKIKQLNIDTKASKENKGITVK
jgi:DNA-binding NtrC family response regulator